MDVVPVGRSFADWDKSVSTGIRRMAEHLDDGLPSSRPDGTSGDIYVVNQGSGEITSYNAKGQQIKPTITNIGGAQGIAFK